MKVFFTKFLIFALVITTFPDWISLIKGHEGFRATEYLDIFNNPTIGYGHLIKKYEFFTTLSEADASFLLEKDLLARVRIIQKMYPKYPPHKIYALAHFIFAKGIGKYLRSDLRKAIESGKSKQLVYKEWIEWGIVDGSYNYKSMYNRTIEFTTFYYETQRVQINSE